MKFREEVGKWQQDLANIVKESKAFKPIKSELTRKQKAIIKSPGEEVDFLAVPSGGALSAPPKFVYTKIKLPTRR